LLAWLVRELSVEYIGEILQIQVMLRMSMSEQVVLQFTSSTAGQDGFRDTQDMAVDRKHIA